MNEEYCPDFIILGFPKCGTTSLARLLETLDGVECCDLKEPHYFSPEFPALCSVNSPEDYRALFPQLSQSKTFEASTWYAYSPTALHRMLKIKPDVRMVLCLRDPLRMAASYHQHLLRRGYEDVEDAVLAWKLQEARADGHDLPAGSTRPETLEYTNRTALGEHYQTLAKIVPSEQLHVLFLEDLTETPQKTLGELGAFLQIKGLETKLLPRENAGRSYRSDTARNLEGIVARAKALKGVKGVLARLGLRDLYRKAIYRQVDTSRTAKDDGFRTLFEPHRRAQLEIIRDVAQKTGQTDAMLRAKRLLVI